MKNKRNPIAIFVLPPLLLLLSLTLMFCRPESTPPPTQPPCFTAPVWVYKDKGLAENAYIPSGWMGDPAQSIQVDEGFADNPQSGNYSVKITYTPGGDWAGVYWQSDANNWGDKPGYCIQGATQVSFWIRSDQDNVKVEAIAGGIDAEGKPFRDSFKVSKVVTTSKEWQQHSIDLSVADLSQVIGGFAIVLTKTNLPDGGTVYLDDIVYTTAKSGESMNAPVLPTGVGVSDYFIPSGWMGDISGITMNTSFTEEYYDPPTSIQVTFKPGELGWAGVYWQYPENNWGDQLGYNLQGATRVSFHAKGATGSEKIEFKVGGIGNADKPYKDSFEASLGTVSLSQNWEQYTIDLSGQDLTNVIGAFVWVASKQNNPSGATFYIDSIVYEGVNSVQPGFALRSTPGQPYMARATTAGFTANQAAFEAKLPALCWVAYAPTNYFPQRGQYPTLESIRTDLRVLHDKAGFQGVITYSTAGNLAEIARIAKELSFKGVILGIWDPTNESEIQQALAADPFVDAYVIGNEGLLFRRYDVKTLGTVMARIRQATGKPVTTTEPVDSFYADDIMVMGDFYFPNVHSIFRNITDPDAAVDWVVTTYNQVAQTAAQKNKLVAFKEVGLPSCGLTGVDEATQSEFYRRLQLTGINYVRFEAYDSPFKAEETGNVFEGCWGFFTTMKRQPKPVAKYACPNDVAMSERDGQRG